MNVFDTPKYKEKIFSLVPAGGYWRDIDPIIAKEYMKSCWFMEGGRTGILRRIRIDEPCLTVLTSPAMKQTDRCHPLEVRPFSYRENARIQTFPEDWVFCGKLSDKYRQVGNGLCLSILQKKSDLLLLMHWRKIEELIQENQIETVQKDTVIEELKQKSPDTLKALYLLAFQTYEGFDKLL